jgi:transposase
VQRIASKMRVGTPPALTRLPMVHNHGRKARGVSPGIDSPSAVGRLACRTNPECVRLKHGPPSCEPHRIYRRALGVSAGFDGHKKKEGSKVHMAVDTLGHLLALLVTPANEQERAQVAELAERVQEVTGLAYVEQGYTGPDAAAAAEEHGIELYVVKLPEAKKGFVLLPRRWAVERSFGWASRFRRLARDSERMPETLAGLHFLAFVCLMLAPAVVALAPGANRL